MKIACFVGEFPCLSETFILSQIIGLIKHGHTIDIYSFKPKSFEKIHPLVTEYNLLDFVNYYPDIPENYVFRFFKAIKILALNFWKSPVLILNSLNFIKYKKHALSFRLFFTLIPFLSKNKEEYHLVHSHFGTTGVIADILRDMNVFSAPVPIVTSFYGFDLSSVIKMYGPKFYENLFKRGDLFIAISRLFKERLIELGCDSKKVVIHYMGIDCSQFIYTSRILSSNLVEIVSIARLVEKKGLEYGIRSIAEVKRQTTLDIRYRIIGDGILRENLSKLICDLGLEDIVFLVGWKSSIEVVEILNQCHIFLAPSVTSQDGDQEGMPVAIMEAMAMGLPVISTFHSGIPELIDNGVSGFLVPEQKSDALAGKIYHLLNCPDKITKTGLEARKKVENYFNENNLNIQLNDILCEVTKNTNGH